MTQADVWYYFDANILILLYNNDLIETLKSFKEQKRAKLLITNEISKEIQNKPKKKNPKNHDVTRIKNLIEEGVLDVIEPDDLNKSFTEELNPLMRDAGEESLLQVICQRNKKHPEYRHIFVTNDERALKRADALNLERETIMNYLNHLTNHNIIECERALKVVEISLSRISKYHK